MNTEQGTPTQTPVLPSSHVRFTREEYLRLRKDQLLTGQSIPWLLKETYFKRADFTPRLDVKTRDVVRRELGYIGNNLNQATRYLHTGFIDDFKAKFDEVYQGFKCLRSFLGIANGDRKDSV